MSDDLTSARERIAELEVDRDAARDNLADWQHDMLAQFDPGAADSTDLYTWIKSTVAKVERLANERNQERALAEQVALESAQVCRELETLRQALADILAFKEPAGSHFDVYRAFVRRRAASVITQENSDDRNNEPDPGPPGP